MIRFELGPMSLGWAGPQGEGRRLLWHQQRARELLRDHEILVNSYPTGAGKTTAALQHLRDRPEASAMVIAPTNELVRQHKDDAQAFCQEHRLRHEVIAFSADAIKAETMPEAFTRSGDRLVRLLQDVRIARGGVNRPVLVVGNPDIFHLALYFQYGSLDRANLFLEMVSRFDYLVIDELHYYDAKQLATFLFYILLSREYGYFEEGRRLAVLTATPEPGLRTLFDRLGLGVAYLAPADEPADLERTPSLAPALVELTAASRDQSLPDLVLADRQEIGERLARAEQGAIISSALWRINLLRAELRRSRFGDRIGAITGPVEPEQRAVAALKDLILATRTVDIGYNFGRPGKERQALDFLYFDARYEDEFLQRLGRAARVLGRRRSDQPSVVKALVDEPLYAALHQLDGQQVSRVELVQQLAEATNVGRNRLLGYLESGAIGEVMLPLHRLARMTARAEQDDVERVFEAVREVFAPRSRYQFSVLQKQMERFWALEKVQRDAPVGLVARVERGFEAFIRENPRGDGRRYSQSERQQLRTGIVPGGKYLQSFETWWEQGAERYATAAAHFAFRESFQPPLALVWDPERYLAESEVLRFDLFHLIQNFVVKFADDALQWSSWSNQSPLADPKVDAYLKIVQPRAPGERLRLVFRLNSEQDRQQWMTEHSAKLRAFKGLRIEAAGERLATAVSASLVKRWVVGLAVQREGSRAAGPLLGLCRSAGFFTRDLRVECGDGRTADCLLLLGTAAIVAASDLRGSLHAELRRLGRTDEATIL